MKKYLWDYVFLFTVAGLIVLLDQWSKAMVRAELAFGEAWAPWDWLLPYARIIHAQNSGAAFGMFQGLAGLFTILAVVVAVIIVYYFPKVPRSDWLVRLALALQFGGAVGNLLDRLSRDGYVTDFISVYTFPVFNVADASITIGVVLLILAMWTKERGSQTAGDSSNLDQDDPPLPEEVQGG